MEPNTITTNDFPTSFAFESCSFVNYSLNDFYYKEYSFIGVDNHTFNISCESKIGLYFIFCWKGGLNISFDIDKQKSITDFQSAVIYDDNLEGVNLFFEKNNYYRFCIIGFNQKAPDENFSFMKFENAFLSQISFNIPIFIGKPYSNLINNIDKLSNRIQENKDSELILEGLIYQILGLKAEYFKDSLNNELNRKSILTNEELKRFNKIAEEIKNNPSFEYSIEYLCEKAALSPLKLQEGFKDIYDSTAMEYVRNSRLDKAVELLKSTNLNISEIVYSIGLTSRSYFSKIFKLKFKCSPRNYRK